MVGLSLAIMTAVLCGSSRGQDVDAIWRHFRVTDNAQAVTDWGQLSAMVPRLRAGDEPLEATTETMRGGAADVYPLAAPATVFIQAGRASGTGFVVDPEGWILTNHHVIENGTVDPRTQALTVTVRFGRLNTEGFMELIQEEVTAVV